jgi:GcrA cell cycle regulator
MEWTEQETRALIKLWPTNSAAQIGKRLQRPRAAVSAKAGRLRREGVPLPAGKFFEINPRPRRTRPKRMIAPPPPVDDSLAMNPCSIIELDRSRCHWPLGGFHDAAAQFCGGNPASGHRYCPHHLRIAHSRATFPK